MRKVKIMPLQFFPMRQVLCLLVLFIAVTPALQAQTKPKKPPIIVRGDPIEAPGPGSTTNAAPAAEAKSEVKAPAAAKGTGSEKDPRFVDFTELNSFEFHHPDAWVGDSAAVTANANEQIPVPLRKLDKQEVIITGFLLPLKYEKGEVREFLILRTQSLCCFGVTPLITEWVNVKLGAGPGIETIPMDEPVSVRGRLHVGAVIENHAVTTIYKMDGAKLVDY